MVKMSDFFKKETPQEPVEPKSLPPEQPPLKNIPIKEMQKELQAPPVPKESLSLKDTSDNILKKIKGCSSQESNKLYQDSLDLIKGILEKGVKNEPMEAQKIKEHIEKLTDQLSLGNIELINLTNTHTPDNYLHAHSVNVCILSILIGIGIGYNRNQLVDLGVASLLHDIGMVKVTDISKKLGKLTEEEYDKIRHHPVFGVDILEMVKDISQAAIYVAKEHHEWANGKGYPQGLEGQEIDEYARIVATVDTYEALTHPRSYRERLHPYEAIRDILKNKEHFDYKFLKVLIEKIGIYPIGSWVQLSTNEIGIVSKVNKDFPLRPIIRVVLDAQGRKIEAEKSVDLITYPSIYIKKPVDAQK